MKRIAKRVFAVLMAVWMAVSLVSCVKKENEAPDGMMIATAAGMDYRLYVPTTWNSNTFYGVSGAYRDVKELSVVSVSRYATADVAFAEESDRNERYWEQVCLPLIRERALNGVVTEYTEDEEHRSHSTVFGGQDAVYRHVVALTEAEERQTLHYLYVIAVRGAYFYVFRFHVTDEMYSYCINDVEKMIRAFEFSETPYEPDDYAWTPANVEAPQGMKIASSDEVAYRLFVPQAWQIDRNQRIFAAYDPNDRTNVSVIPYFPETDGMSVPEFFTMANDLMKTTADAESYSLIGTGTETTLGGQSAMEYEFTYTLGGQTYHYRQIIAVHRGMFYTMTYTATEARYAEHLDVWNAVKDAFCFR